MKTPTTGTVYVVEDDRLARSSIRDLCEEAGLMVYECCSAEEFLELQSYERPATIILDIRLRRMSGIALQEELAARRITIPTVILSAFASVPIAVRCLRRGAFHLLEKPFSGSELLTTVNEAIKADQHQVKMEHYWEELNRTFSELSRRERYVLEGLLQGRMNKVLAGELDVSIRTVEQDRANILRKFNVKNSTELAVKATEHRIFSNCMLRHDQPQNPLRRIGPPLPNIVDNRCNTAFR